MTLNCPGVVRPVGLPSLALALCVFAAGPAWAHMMPAQQGTLNVVGNGVFAALSLPLSALAGVDDDGDGRLSPSELRAHETLIRDEVARRVRIGDGDRPGRIDFLQVTAEADDRDPGSSAGSAHFLALMKASFDGPPAALRLETDFWGRADGDRQLTMKASRGSNAEIAVLTPRRTSHDFFRPSGQALAGYWPAAALLALALAARAMPRSIPARPSGEPLA